ncbi:VOC family protein [Actinoplanes bogorensis]|uniref:VOC family protein n=1 Tax=Paractinoplanes bogorensis TaxID=1610840 RepID=A0ABS5YML5_9ACTN|nr:VOC family protein [Actinoplanes bogorensis]MBU2664655.1 VOC family protein [Actinoplanes bogorensis]
MQSILSTPRFDRMLAFYAGVFGAVETMRFPEEGDVFYVGLRIGDSELGLVNEPDAGHEASARYALSIEVDDVDALLGPVEALGGKLLGAPNDMPWGQRVAHVHDPDGNLVNLTR